MKRNLFLGVLALIFASSAQAATVEFSWSHYQNNPSSFFLALHNPAFLEPCIFETPQQLVDTVSLMPAILFMQNGTGNSLLHWLLFTTYAQNWQQKAQQKEFLRLLIQVMCNITGNENIRYLDRETMAALWPRRPCTNKGRLNLAKQELFLNKHSQLPHEILTPEQQAEFINDLITWYPADQIDKTLNLLCTIEDLVLLFMGKPCYEGLYRKHIPGWQLMQRDIKPIRLLHDYLLDNALESYKNAKLKIAMGAAELMSS